MADQPNPSAPSANESIADDVTTHTINLLRVADTMRGPVLAELERLEQSLVAEIAKLPDDPTSNRMARLDALLGQTRGSIAGAYQTIQDNQGKALGSIAAAEQAKTNTVVNAAIGAEVMSVAQTPEQLQTLSSKLILEGKFLNQWWAKQGTDLQDKFVTTMRDGIHRGEGIDALVRRVRGSKEAGYNDGIMAVSKANAETLVRTSVQTMANAARLLSFEKNPDVIKGVQWRATLDDRTSKICMALDGKVWSLPDYKPVNHDTPFPGPIAHFNCRSVQVAVTRSWDDLSGPNAVVPPVGPPAPIDDLLRQKLLAAGIPADKVDAIVAKKKGAMNGEAAPPVRFEDWLGTKSHDFQNKLLGPQRAQLWREGAIKLKDLIGKDLEPLSLSELHQMIAKGQAVQSNPPVEGQNKMSLLDRKLLQESLAVGVQHGEVMTHFIDLETGVRVSIKGTSPSVDDVAQVQKFGKIGVIRNALVNGEVFSPQEINLFGKLDGFQQARVVNPGGRVLTINVKKGQTFDRTDAAEVNELNAALANTKAVPSLIHKLSKAIHDHGALSVRVDPLGTITLPPGTYNQGFPQVAKPAPFFDPEKIAQAQAAESAKLQAAKMQAEAEAAANAEAAAKATKEAERQEAAQIAIHDAEKKSDALSVAMTQLAEDAEHMYVPTELIAAAKAKVAADQEAALKAAELKAQQEAEAKAAQEAADKKAAEEAAAKLKAEQEAAAKKAADDLAAKLKAEAEAAAKKAADELAAKLKAEADALAAKLKQEAEAAALKAKQDAEAAAAKAKADAAAALAKAQADALAAKEKAAYDKATVATIAAYGPGSPANPPVINGIPWTSPKDEWWKDVKDVAFKDEPAVPKGVTVSTGVIFIEDDGSMWVYSPTNEFGGYKNTFSKGRAEPDITLQQNALKEAHEELGLHGEINGYLGDFKGDVTTTRFYIGKRTGGEPWTAHANGETDYVKLATPDQLKVLFNKPRDQKVLEAVAAYLKPPAKGPLAGLVYVKDLPGTTHPALMRNPKTGEEFVLKREPGNPGHVREEFTANEAYRAMGIAVPEQVLVEETDGPALLSKFIPNGQEYGTWMATATPAKKKAMIAELQKGFVMDALLANYDVIGTGNNNILVDKDGAPIRLDNGGSLRYRAQGAPKPSFGEKVTELDSMRDPVINSYAGNVFKSISQGDLRQQILDVLAKRDDILAAMPADLRDLMGKRIDDLAKRMPPDTSTPAPGTYTDADAKAIAAAKANGFNLNGDRDFIESNRQLFWPETNLAGDRVTKGEVYLSVEGSSAVYKAIEGSLQPSERINAIGGSLGSSKPAPVAPAASTYAYTPPATASNAASAIANAKLIAGDSFYGPIITAASNVNYHLGNKAFNGAKLDAALALQPMLEAYAKTGTAAQKGMAAQYLPVLDVLAKAKGATAATTLTPIPFLSAYAPPTPKATAAAKKAAAAAAAAPVPVPSAPLVLPGITVKQVQLTFPNKKIVNGELVQTSGSYLFNKSMGDGQAIHSYDIEVGGATIRFTPFVPRPSAYGDSDGFAFQGRIEVTTPGEPSPDVLDRISKAFKTLGIENSPASQEYMELAYLKRGFFSMKLNDDAGYKAIVNDANLTDAQKIAELKLHAQLQGVPPAAFTGPGYNPAGRVMNRQDANGHTVFERWDLPRAQVETEMPNHALYHSTLSRKISEVVEGLLGSGGEATPTVQRLRKGLFDAKVGMSAERDMGTGGANYWFTRVRDKADTNVRGMYFKIGNIARQDAISYPGDRYGNTQNPSTLAERKTTVAQYKQMASAGNNDETIFRNGLNLVEEIDQIRCVNATEKKLIIALFKKYGFAKLPDGRKIDDIVQVAK